MLRAIFFDAAGTLFDACEPIGRTYARLARDYGVDAPEAAVAASFRRAFGSAPGLAFGPGKPATELRRLEREWWRTRVADTFAGLGNFIDFDAYFDALFAYFADPGHWRVSDEAASTLKRLKDRGTALGVISTFDHRIYHILDGLELSPYFETITISSEAGFAKPSREVFEVALRRTRVEPRDAMHVGDSEDTDLGAAEAAGLVAVLINPQRAPAPAQITGRVARISSLASVIEVAQGF
jgi:putative hydrolase of the HAD superfamily